jgi:hypothetical protein
MDHPSTHEDECRADMTTSMQSLLFPIQLKLIPSWTSEESERNYPQARASLCRRRAVQPLQASLSVRLRVVCRLQDPGAIRSYAEENR